MLLNIVVLFIFLHHCHSQSVNFTDCGLGNVKDVRIIPCSGQPCMLKLGTNVTVEADFNSPINTNKLSEVIKGVIRGREVPFPEQRSDPCKSGNILPRCPLKQGSVYQFKATFELKPFYPAIPIEVKYALTDPTGKTVACVQIAAKIIDPNAKETQKGSGQRSRNSRPKQKKKKDERKP